MRTNFINFKATAEGAEIAISGVIGESYWGDTYSLERLRQDLKAVKGDKVTITINSPGGEVSEGIAIYHALKNSGKKVTTVAAGWAASIASIVFMAGSTRIVETGSRVMIHNPWTFTEGDAKELRKTADVLDQLQSDLVDIYHEATGMAKDILRSMVDAETWLSAEEALTHKFATESRKKAAPTAKACLTADICGKFLNLPGDLRPELTQNHTAMNPKLLALLGVSAAASEQEVLDAATNLKNVAASLTAKNEEVSKLTLELTEAKAKVSKFEQAEKDAAAKALKAEAKQFADKAVSDKRIAAADADKWANAYEKDAEQAKALLPSVPSEGSGHPNVLACGSTATGEPTPSAEKILEQYHAEKDPMKKAALYAQWKVAK